MIYLLRALCGFAALIFSTPSSAEPFDPAAFRTAVGGQATQIMVLGSPHLAQEPDRFDTAWLGPLLEQLEQYRPDAIIVEALPGEAAHALVQYEAIYPGVAEMFAERRLQLASEASVLLGTSMPEAEAKARDLSDQWPADPTPDQRRNLIAHLIAAGELNSALLQWLRLEEQERVAQGGISEAAAAHLQRTSTSRNEIVAIAVQLARRLGLERVHAMDDQSDSDLVFSVLDAVSEAESSESLARARSRRPLPQFTPMTSAESVLAAFREHNSDETGRQDAEHQWLARLETDEHQAIQRRRVAAWETRNLRMAANIREVSARHPGGKVLVLVGSAHKPYLDAYLRLMSDVRVVDSAEVLGNRNSR